MRLMGVNASEIRIEEVASIAQVEALRLVRNATTGSFAHFNGCLGYDQQQVWWQKMHDRAELRAWLYYWMKPVLGEGYPSFTLVGYGMVREDPGNKRWWNSIAVLPVWRQYGLGTFITTDVVTRSSKRIYAAVRKDNMPGLRMHKPEFWTQLREEELPLDFNEPERLVYFESKIGPQ